MANIENHYDLSIEERHTEGAETYDEAYYKTGLGPMAYEHSPHWLSFFASVADEIIRVFQPDTVFDAGCAIGLLVEALLDRGVKAQGVDISRYAIENVRPDLRSHCRVASLMDPIEGTFDVVTCIEVLEHVESADARIVVANLCNVTDTILFSSTPSDFTEPTHVNVCPPIVWIELFAAQGFGPDLLADGTFLTPHTMIFRRGNSCDIPLLKTYALISRYRILCSERLDVIGAERNKADRAREAQLHAENQLARETQLRAEVQAALEAERAVSQAALTAEYAAVEAQRHLEAQAAVEAQARQRADAQASLQAQLRAEALAKLTAETVRYQAHLRDLQGLLHDMQRSNSWRLTWPVRIAGLVFRNGLNRLRLRANCGTALSRR